MLTDLNNVERHLALRIAGNLAQYARTHLKNEGFTLDGTASLTSATRCSSTSPTCPPTSTPCTTSRWTAWTTTATTSTSLRP